MYLIPSFNNYYIDENECVFNKKNGKRLYGSINGSGYRFYHLMGDDERDYNVGEHRLVALARIEKPLTEERLVVNHKDGVKLHNKPTNLEWCTYSQNAIHAGHSGLSPKACSVQVRDVRTDEVFYFQTMLECAAHFAISKDAVSYRCHCGPVRIFPGGFQYRTPASHEDWPSIDDIDLVLLENGTKKAVYIKDLQTGLIEPFEKLLDASKFLEVTLGNLSGHFNRSSQPVLKDRYQLKKCSDREDWKEPHFLNAKQKVLVVDTKLGKETIYKTAREAAFNNNLKPTALTYRLMFNGEKIFPDGKTYKRI